MSRTQSKLTLLDAKASKLDAILGSSLGAIITIDSHGIVQGANPATERLFGYRPEDLIGRNVNCLMPEPFRSGHDRYVRDYLATGERKIIGIGREVVGLRKDDTTFPMYLSVSEFEMDGGRYFIGTVYDMSARTQWEAMASRLGWILDDSINEIYAFDAETLRFVMVNRGARRNLGYDMEELAARTPVDIKPEFPRERFNDLIEPLRSGDRERLSFQTIHRRKDGSEYDVEVDLQLSHAVEPPVFVAIVLDITDRKRAELRLQLLERVAETVETGILITDPTQPDNPVVYVNPAMERLTGFPAEEILGRNPRFLQNKDRDQPGLDKLRKAMESGERERVELRNYRKDGEMFLLDLAIFPLRDAAGNLTHHIGIHNDITERRALEERLLHANRMDAIGQLTGGIAHDFNNLLTVIVGNLELLEMRLDDPRLRELVREAQEGADMGARLTDRLLTFARRRHLEPEIVDLNEFVLGTTELLHRTLGETIDLSTRIAPDLWHTRADPSQIENAIVNLAINARDAMPAGGRLVIETRNTVLDGDYAAVEPGLAEGEYVQMSMTDAGHGMAPKVRDRALEPFFTTKEAGRGSELGLSTIYGFAKQSGGHLAIYSEEGKGTTVSLYLPRVDGEHVEAPTGTSPAGEGSCNGETILVVEDDERVRRLTVGRLESLGYRVVDASDGPGALKILAADEPVDLVFTDLVMPGGISGYQLAERVREVHPGVRLLLTSGYAEELLNPDDLERHRLRVLRKPYRQAQLARAIRETLETRG